MMGSTSRRGRVYIDSNVIIDAIGALIVLTILFASRRLTRDRSPLTRLIHALMVCCVMVFLSDILGLALDGRDSQGARALLWFFDTVYWILHILYFWLWAVFADLWIFQSEAAARRRSRMYLIPMLLQIAIILSNPWTGWMFALNAENAYTLGSAYQLCLIPHYSYLLLSIVIALTGYRTNNHPEGKQRCLTLLTYMLLPICGAAMELVAYGVSWVWPMIALSLLMVYLGEQQRILTDKQLSVARAAETAARMDAEMAMSRMAIMLSQIQPHFLYNALCVIQDLCHEKAPEAESATIAFSRFLRGNLDSLNSDKPIPFKQEINHTQYYLALEQMRFGKRLKVEYDLQAEGFRLPALTLQPIVENAVRYGVMKKAAGGTVRISSVETAQSYVITVQDNGAGFDPYGKHDDGRTHIGIDNVRQRLRAMCGGDIEIVSHAAEGTTATLTLPKGGAANENPCA